MEEVRQALSDELIRRGLDVATDTYSSRGEVYVKGAGDLASALFEFKDSVDDAMETMYQGHRSVGMPPLFAVLPHDSADDPSFELLEQMGIRPLLYRRAGDAIAFLALEELLGPIMPGA